MHYYPASYRRGTARRSLAAVLRADCCAVTVCSRGDPRMDVETFTHQQQLQQAGRGDRVARTREAIIASALALALAGEVAPIVRDIAKMAGVSARSAFQHLSDTAELYVAVLSRVLAAVVGEAPDHETALAIADRIGMIIDLCSDRCERLLPM